MPPNPSLGHLALPLFSLGTTIPALPSPFGLIAKVAQQRNYLNFKADIPKLASVLFAQVREKGINYCSLLTDGKRVIIEHTSANPLHPMHIGHARNAFLGDSLARLMRARGHNVSTHFYVDDMGLQVMIATIGFKRSPKKPDRVKPDHWIGFVYAVSNIMYELAELKPKLAEGNPEYADLIKKRDELAGYAESLREKFPDEFDQITAALSGMSLEEWNQEIAAMIKGMESGDPSVTNPVRDLVNLALDGFKQTLGEAGIQFDQWDWESEQASGDEMKALLSALSSSPFRIDYKGVVALDCESIAKQPEVAKKILPETKLQKEIPPMVLTRADGSTLYQTRDVLYSLRKLAAADEVYNVIGAEQTLAQLQVKLALFALNHPKAAHLHHVPYELVRLPGRRMAGRYGSYVTLDEVMSLAITMASNEVRKRNPDMEEAALLEAAKAIGIGAVKYALISVNAQKVVEFEIERALNFDENSAPFLQYAAVRSRNVLSVAERRGINRPTSPDFSRLTDPDEEKLVLLCSRLPDTAVYAADSLHVEALASHLMDIANAFNSYYTRVPILAAGDDETVQARLALAEAVSMAITSGLSLLGIDVPKKM